MSEWRKRHERPSAIRFHSFYSLAKTRLRISCLPPFQLPYPQRPMAVPQNTIAIVYDYDQTLSPNYMQEEVLFPAFGIDAGRFWKKCQELVANESYDHELAYMRVMLDYLDIDRPTNARLRELGRELRFY